jgi:hypothetical protein
MPATTGKPSNTKPWVNPPAPQNKSTHEILDKDHLQNLQKNSNSHFTDAILTIVTP